MQKTNAQWWVLCLHHVIYITRASFFSLPPIPLHLVGQWAYFEKLVNLSDILFWNEEGELDLKMNGYLVHGGDSTDKGCGDIQVVKALIGLKQRYPDRVFLILGNRDVNKLRFTSELVPGRDGALVNVFWDAKHVPFAKWLEIGKRPTSKRIQTLQVRAYFRLCLKVAHLTPASRSCGSLLLSRALFLSLFLRIFCLFFLVSSLRVVPLDNR